MPQYKAPGVYVEEVERGPKPIEGVSTSVAGFLGGTERGPQDPRLVTSFADYRRLYGGVAEASNLAHAVKGFFDNGGHRCYIGRVTRWEQPATGGAAGHDPAAATLGIHPTTLDFGWVAEATSVTRSVVVTNRGDPAADDPDVTVTGLAVTASDSDDEFFEPEDLTSTNGSREVTLAPGEQYVVDVEVVLESGDTGDMSATLEISHDGDAPSSPAEVALEATGVAAGNQQLAISTGEVDFGSMVADSRVTRMVSLTNLGAAGDDPITIASTGIDGDGFEVDPEIGSDRDVGPGDSLELEVTAAPDSAGTASAALEINHNASTPSATASSPTTIALSADVTGPVLEADAVGPGPWGERVALSVGDATMYKPGRNELFSLTVRYWRDAAERDEAAAVYADPAQDADEAPAPDVEQTFDNLSPDPASDNYYVEEVTSASTLVDLSQPDGETGRPGNGVTWLHHEAADDVAAEVNVTHYEGSAIAAEDRTGLAAFEQVDEITIVCAPDENDFDDKVTTAVVNHCHEMEDRVAVLQAEEDAAPPGSLSPPVDTSYAAFYYPWITVTHPETGNDVTVPPGGHVAGIYARSDAEQGVHKAPANEVVRGVTSLPVAISQGDQATLNPKGVNCIRSFRGRGIRLWGARTTSSDPSWKYVNVRRLFLFIEESIDEGTQWVVFEPNDADLWARVRQSVSNFLTSVWEDGALMGTTPDEAFYVKCDRTTMTQNDIDNGRLICEIGIAPVKPAEFVVFRISQWTAGAEGGG